MTFCRQMRLAGCLFTILFSIFKHPLLLGLGVFLTILGTLQGLSNVEDRLERLENPDDN